MHNQEQGVDKAASHANHKKEKVPGVMGTIIIGVAIVLIGSALKYFGNNPRILYLGALGICVLFLYGTHIYVRSELAKRQPLTPSVVPTQPKISPPAAAPGRRATPHIPGPAKPKSPLTSLSDGQRFVLKQKLHAYSGSSIRLILIGNDPQGAILFEQLADIFKEAGWKLETGQIGMVAIVGITLPRVPYLTASNIASPIVGGVFSIFSRAGVDLPLVPHAFMGPSSAGTITDIVIVIPS
jgi:hypothetical protein